jgi:hypothetical protein
MAGVELNAELGPYQPFESKIVACCHDPAEAVQEPRQRRIRRLQTGRHDTPQFLSTRLE